MKTVRELFAELDDWKTYAPDNTMSSIAKDNHITRLKQEIKNRIDVEDYKDYILSKEEN